MIDWVHQHAFGVLLTIEILWVAGFLAVFVVYFFVRRRLKKQPKPPGADASKDTYKPLK